MENIEEPPHKKLKAQEGLLEQKTESVAPLTDPGWSSSELAGRLALASPVPPTRQVGDSARKEEGDDDDDGLFEGVVRYHCDFCGHDISTTIRIRCAECQDYDLCVECFATGRESRGHLNYHSYYVIGRNPFMLFAKDWNADEEVALLEAVSKFGLGNWNDVGEALLPYSHKTKKSHQCETHYLDYYLNEDICARLLEGAEAYVEKFGPILDPGTFEGLDVSPIGRGQKSSDKMDVEFATVDNLDGRVDLKGQQLLKSGSLAGDAMNSRPASSKAGGAASQLVGYMPLRGDFDVEHDNDAELILADMEIHDSEAPHELELKLQVLEIYNSKIDERIIRKKTLIARNLLDPRKLQQADKRKSKEERELHALLRPLARFSLQTDHERLISLLLDERRLRSRLQRLQEWKSQGLRTTQDVSFYEAEKRKRADQLRRPASPYIVEAPKPSKKKGSSSAARSPLEARVAPEPQHPSLPAPVHSYPGARLCTRKELEFCQELQIAPVFFLLVKSVLIKETEKSAGGIDREGFTKLIRLDGQRVGSIFDFVLHTNLNAAS